MQLCQEGKPVRRMIKASLLLFLSVCWMYDEVARWLYTEVSTFDGLYTQNNKHKSWPIFYLTGDLF